MTREKAINHIRYGIIEGNYPLPKELGIEACEMAIKALEQEPCEDCISRQELDKALYEHFHEEGNPNNITDVRLGAVRNFVKNFPPVIPQPKIGRWTLKQRGKYIDINCSECSNTRIKSYSYGYTIDELNLDNINNLIAETQMNYCECCGAKMEEPQESEVKKCQ